MKVAFLAYESIVTKHAPLQTEAGRLCTLNESTSRALEKDIEATTIEP